MDIFASFVFILTIYNAEIAANLRRQEEEEELRREAEGRRRPMARSREQEDSRRPSSGRLQERKTANNKFM